MKKNAMTKKRAKRPEGPDNALMQEIEAFLADFDITKAQFVDYIQDVEEWNKDERALDRGNVFQYFESRSVPLFNMWKIANYLCTFVDELPLEVGGRYQEGAEEIKDKIVAYIVEARDNPTFFRATIRTHLHEMEDQDIENLFRSLYIFTYPERVFTFWACYCCLNYEVQAKIRDLLSSFPIPPAAYASKLAALHTWELEVNAPICAKFDNRCQKYKEQLEAAKTAQAQEEARKAYIEKLVNLLQKYPYVFTDRVFHFSERVSQNPTMDDWAIMSTYSLVCSALDREEQIQIDRAILEYLTDPANWLMDKRTTRKVAPEAIVHHYMDAFRSCSAL